MTRKKTSSDDNSARHINNVGEILMLLVALEQQLIGQLSKIMRLLIGQLSKIMRMSIFFSLCQSAEFLYTPGSRSSGPHAMRKYA